MKESKSVSLSLLGKNSIFPFTGVFFAKQQFSIANSSGHMVCKVIGRVNDCDIKRDFQAVMEMGVSLENHLDSLSNTYSQSDLTISDKQIMRDIWDWHKELSYQNKLISLMCLVDTIDNNNGFVSFSAKGISSVWANQNHHMHEWFSLLPSGHNLFQDHLVEGYPVSIKIHPKPSMVLVQPKMIDGISTDESISTRVFEVGDA